MTVLYMIVCIVTISIHAFIKLFINFLNGFLQQHSKQDVTATLGPHICSKYARYSPPVASRVIPATLMSIRAATWNVY